MGTVVSLPAGSPEARSLVALALDVRGWPDAEKVGDPDAALAVLERWAVPLKAQEPEGMVRDETADLGFRFEGAATARLVDALRPIGMKINPALAPQQVGGWLAAMVAALSDLPPRVAIRGAQDAIHVPMKFLNEVETAVREKAEPVAARYALAKSRLERMKREIAEAAKPAKPQLPPPPPMTQDDLNALSRNEMGRTLLSMGLKAGHVTQEQFDIAMSRVEQTEGTE